MGHLNTPSLVYLSNKNLATSILNLSTSTGMCEACQIGKQHKKKSPKVSQTQANEVLEVIHSDLCGPLLVMSLRGSSYFITFTDDYSRKS